ncbi:hypothetical protein J1614_004129 [Plenodomus biglobosus]|nr:hypothetical protein J1614_004129 [Plenodomus biglobosus]
MNLRPIRWAINAMYSIEQGQHGRKREAGYNDTVQARHHCSLPPRTWNPRVNDNKESARLSNSSNSLHWIVIPCQERPDVTVCPGGYHQIVHYNEGGAEWIKHLEGGAHDQVELFPSFEA